MRHLRTRFLRFALKVAVSGGLIWLILLQIDIGELGARIKPISAGGIVLVVLVLLLQCVVASLRWAWIIRVMGYSFPFAAALRAWLIGHFLGQGFPSTIGHDAFRVVSLRLSGIPTPAAFEIIVLDRFTGLIGLMLLVAVTLPLLVSMAPNPAPLYPLAIITVGAVLAVILLFSRFSMPTLHLRFPALVVVSQFRSNLRRLVETRRNMLWMLLPALSAHLLTVLAAYIIARDGATQIDFLQCLAIIPPAILVSVIPLSIAGWGIREGSVVAGALLIGIPTADALFVSVLLGFGFLAVGIIGGLIWLVTGRGDTMHTRREKA